MKASVHNISAEDLLTRLRKIEGQVRGLQRMVERDDRCVDVLTQIASVRAALAKVGVALVDAELRRLLADGDHGRHETDPTDVLTAVELLVHR